MTYDDVMVRVWALSMLLRLRSDVTLHCDLAQRLVRTLLSRERDLLLVTSYKQFSNSLSHRQKHRVFTALLTLHKFLPQVTYFSKICLSTVRLFYFCFCIFSCRCRKKCWIFYRKFCFAKISRQCARKANGFYHFLRMRSPPS